MNPKCDVHKAVSLAFKWGSSDDFEGSSQYMSNDSFSKLTT